MSDSHRFQRLFLGEIEDLGRTRFDPLDLPGSNQWHGWHLRQGEECVTLRSLRVTFADMPSGEIDRVEVGLNLGVLSIKGGWKANDAERDAAWALCVELCLLYTSD